MAILFITHDFGVVARMCDRVAVMYAGRIVECGPVRQVFEHPSHPYTQALIASVPKMTGTIGRLTTIEGQPPSLLDLPAGCRFAPRCAYAEQRCRDAYPRQLRCRRCSIPPIAGGSRPHDRRAAAAGRAPAQVLPVHQRRAARQDARRGEGGGRRLVHHRRRRNPRAGGRIRLRQDNDLEADPQSGAADQRAGAAGRQADPRAARRGAARLPRAGAGGVPGPVVLAQSAHDGRPDHRRIADRDRLGQPREDRRAGQRTAAAGRAAAGAGVAVSARVQRRTAPAHRAGRRAGVAAAADRAGRTGLGAGRLDPRADDEPAEGHPGAGQCRLPAGRARSRHGALHGRRHRGHVSGQDRRIRADAIAVRRCPPSLHEGAAVRGAAAARRSTARTRSC